MFVTAVWHYIFGYVIIKVEGLSLEKFLNLCLRRGIRLWNAESQSYSVLKARTNITGLKRLVPIAYATHSRVHILGKRGLPFLIYRLRYRYMFIVGFIAFFAVIYFLSSFIWIIEIEGNARIPGQVILEQLEQSGLKAGIRKKNLPIRAIEADMLLKMPELSWIGIEIDGTKARVQVVEAVMPPPRVPVNEPCDIVAAKDGLIYKITVLEGQAVVKVGQTVKQGQLLVTGAIKTEGADTRYVHAMAEITARRWYEGYAQKSLTALKKERTGQKVIKRYMLWKAQKIYISNPEVPFTSYEMVRTVHLAMDKLNIPVRIVTEEYYETREETIENDIEAVRQEVQQLAIDDALKNIPKDTAQIVNKKVDFEIDDKNVMHGRALVEVLERIDQQKSIEIQEDDLPSKEEKNIDNTAKRR